MKKINFQNNITKVNKATFDEFQNNIEESCVAVSPTQPETNERVWIQKGKNLFKDSLVNGLGNTEYNNGTVIQKTADTNQNPNWKLSGYNNYDYVTAITSFTPSLGRNSFTFVKKSNFNNLQLGVNGSSIDTVIYINVADLKNEETYTISFNVLNKTQGSISWKDIQLEQGSTATEYEAYVEKKIYCKNDNGVYEEFINAEDINGSNWKKLELLTNWENLGGNYFTAQYKKIGNQIFLRGLVKNTIDSGKDKAILLLPEDIRPKKTAYVVLNMNDTFLSAYINTNGYLLLENYTAGNWIDVSNTNYFID